MFRLNRTLMLALALCAQVGPPLARADAARDKRALILVRALSYDANLRDRVGDQFVLAVLGRRSPEGEACSASMRQAFGALGAPKVAGVPMRVAQVWLSSPEALASAVSEQGLDALYVCDGLDPDLASILEVARKQRVLTLGSTEAQVTRGVALAVVVLEAKPALLINITAAKNAGAALSSDLLRVARVVR